MSSEIGSRRGDEGVKPGLSMMPREIPPSVIVGLMFSGDRRGSWVEVSLEGPDHGRYMATMGQTCTHVPHTRVPRVACRNKPKAFNGRPGATWKKTLPLIMRTPRWDIKCGGCSHKGGLISLVQRCSDVKPLGRGSCSSWESAPVCRVQHQVPLRRCEEARMHPTGRLDDGRLQQQPGQPGRETRRSRSGRECSPTRFGR